MQREITLDEGVTLRVKFHKFPGLDLILPYERTLEMMLAEQLNKLRAERIEQEQRGSPLQAMQQVKW